MIREGILVIRLARDKIKEAFILSGFSRENFRLKRKKERKKRKEERES